MRAAGSRSPVNDISMSFPGTEGPHEHDRT